MSDYTSKLLCEVKQWLEEQIENIRFGIKWAYYLREFLKETCGEIWNPIEQAARECFESALRNLREKNNKSRILQSCRDNEEKLRSILQLGTKMIIRAGAQVAAKGATGFLVKTALKTAANPIGLVADGVQVALEAQETFGNGKKANLKKVARDIGFGGNVAAGAYTGFMLGGPVGAGMGAAVGGGIWFIGELVGTVFSAEIAEKDKKPQ